jgi:hypothetical protein
MTLDSPMLVNGPRDDVPPCRLTKADIEAVAAATAAAVNYSPPSPLEPIVTQLGGSVEFLSNLDTLQKSGAIHVRKPGDFTIYLPLFASKLRNRFTIAHELGHFVLHSNLGKKEIWVARGGTGRTEWEANWFAGAFLMPKVTFQEKLSRMQTYELASFFGVSEAAIEVRKQHLESM